MKISEVIQYLDPDKQTTINALVSKAGMNGDATVDQLLDAYPISNSNLVRDERLALVSLSSKRPNKFAPKLNFQQRCEVLALHRQGFSREVLAKMYCLDRRTVTHICTKNSPHYKNVRQEEIGMGRERFEETYLYEGLIDKALAFSTAMAETSVNNKHAKTKAGVHTMRGQMCDYDHRVAIQWREPDGKHIHRAGWYYQDMDGSFPDRWFHAGEESMKTSKACYDAALIEIADKEWSL